jgi:hypothetical protein
VAPARFTDHELAKREREIERVTKAERRRRSVGFIAIIRCPHCDELVRVEEGR